MIELEHRGTERSIAGFRRRLSAFTIDILILLAFGLGLGFFFFDELARMGGTGRLIGFAVALAYFGIQNSWISGGQTPGKRALKIRVADSDGHGISIGRSFVRSTILIVPHFLNGVQLGYPAPLSRVAADWIGFLQGILVFGLGGSIIYLFVFNRRTRQSTHDLVCRTYVIRKNAWLPTSYKKIWAWHYAVVTCLLVGIMALMFGMSVFIQKMDQTDEIMGLYRQLSKEPDYTQVKIMDMHSSGPGGTVRSLDVTVRLRKRPEDYQKTAEKIAEKVFAGFPGVERRDYLKISLAYGYDIGIASMYTRKGFIKSPGGWKVFRKGIVDPESRVKGTML